MLVLAQVCVLFLWLALVQLFNSEVTKYKKRARVVYGLDIAVSTAKGGLLNNLKTVFSSKELHIKFPD